MNKSALRNFAVNARRDLIKIISDRANLLGVYENKPESQIQAETDKGFVINGITYNYPKQMRDDFIKRVKQVGYQDAIEEIAYTWFNRIVALRFMEINGYLKNGKNGEVIYVIGSTTAGKSEPDAVTYADKLSFVDKEIVYKYQDENKTNELYRYILTSQCNELNKVMPLMFEKIDNYVELLLPDHLIDDNGSVIAHLVNDIDARDFNITVKDENGENASQVEIIGWLYQYYISEKKEDVFAGLKNNTKITKGTLPAATQIFTPDWIVRYMTDNTLGKMWIESRNSNLKKDLKYYLEPAEQTEEVKKKLDEINKEYARKNVKEITFIDPCCGSGHILVYAFEIFYKMYQESGYLPSEIPALILKNNLFGIDVDKRAAQLTSFALTMKALNYDKDFLKKQVFPNVIDIKESNLIDMQELKDFISLAKLNTQDEEIVLDLIEKFKDAELYGSLIKDFKYTPEQYDIVLKEVQNVDDNQFQISNILAVQNIKPILTNLLRQAIYLSSKYDVVVTNPPYAGNSKLPANVGQYLSKSYPNTKSDLFSAFIERNMLYSTASGQIGIMCPYVWMFIQSYEKLRVEIIYSKSITSLVQLEYGGFAEAVVPICTFTLRNCKTNETGEFIRLEQFKGPDLQGPKTLEAVENKNCGYRYSVSSNNFSKIPGSPIAYWVSGNIFNLFNHLKLGNIGDTRKGMYTGLNDKYVRQWTETDSSKCLKGSNKKWFKYANGGDHRKWYGNLIDVVDWENNGFELQNTKGDNGKIRAGCFNLAYIFNYGIVWSSITSSKPSVRLLENDSLFSSASNAWFGEEIKNVLGFMNSKVFQYLVNIINPTLNFNAGDIGKVPYVEISKFKKEIEEYVKANIFLSKLDWDQYETSWDFKKNPLLPTDFGINANWNIASQYVSYKNIVNQRFDTLKQNEEELNRIFIDIYGLQDELTPDVEDKDITVARIYDKKEDIPESMKGNIYVRTKQDVVKDLLSYIVGCAFGRYSPYKEGLIFAGGDFNWEIYFNMLNNPDVSIIKNIKTVTNAFLPTDDNCIVNTDNDYVEFNLVDRVIEFVRLIFGQATLEENLRFIANALDEKSNDTPRNVIREYLANDFFKDHCKKYQNRPIYWQFDSGKNGGFRALMYLHRYDQNTIPTVRLSYLHDIQWKYEHEKDRLEQFIEKSNLTAEKAKAKKELDLINKQILECKAYDEILNHASNMNIQIDLDDGVKVNYQKFQKLDGDKEKNIFSTYLKF